MKKTIGLLVFTCLFFLTSVSGYAVEKKEDQTFSRPFQNQTTSLSGRAVRSSMYFVKEGYWDVKKAELNLTYQVTQLDKEQDSDLTVSLNGVKIMSWHPESGESETKRISLPVADIQGTNVLTIEGQIVTSSNQEGRLIQTPANWLTIKEGSVIDFDYDVPALDPSISDFYTRFKGVDQLANSESVIMVPEDASEKELAAAGHATIGLSRSLSTETGTLPMHNWNEEEAQKKTYQLWIGKYEKLPEKYRQEIEAGQVDNQAVLKVVDDGNKAILLVTSNNEDRLIEAGRYLANSELMLQTSAREKRVNASTNTAASSDDATNRVTLTNQRDELSGVGHQEQNYFVQMPVNYTNLNDSQADIRVRYSDNLDFSSSMVTLYVNDQPIGSQRLVRNRADGDTLAIDFPDGISAAGSFNLTVAFDLVTENEGNLAADQAPWAVVDPTSTVTIDGENRTDVLFSNYPSVLIDNGRLNDLSIVMPERMTKNYSTVLTNLFNLIGSYTKNNTEELTFYKNEPSRNQLESGNLLVIGTPDDNPVIRSMNDDLYFKYDQNFTTFLSNEKLSIEQEYGKRIGTAQLLRSPYNENAVALAVTGITPESVALASTQLKSQAEVSIYKGDALVIDPDYQRLDYRFKKHAQLRQQSSVADTLQENESLIVYLVLFALAILTIGLILYFMIKKYGISVRRGE